MILTFDLETHLITETNRTPKPVCYSYTIDGHAPELLQNLQHLGQLIDQADLVIGHNIVFDFGVLAEHCGMLDLINQKYINNQVRDTKILELLHLIRIGELHHQRRPSLQMLARQYLGSEITKNDDIRLHFADLEEQPIDQWPEEFVHYAKTDAIATWNVYQAQAKDFHPDELALQHRADWCLHRMGCLGIAIDSERVTALAADLEAQMVEADARLKAVGLVRADGSRNMQAIRDAVATAFAPEPPPRTPVSPRFPEGQVQCSADVLKDTNVPELRMLADRGGIEKTLGFVQILKDREVFLPEWNVLVATGRTSCGSEDHPGNIQNQPRKGGVRECWKARDGYLLCSCDWVAAELCALAQITYSKYGHSVMRDRINSGEDLHQWFADQTDFLDRQGAKACNFGFLGGLGSGTFVEYAKNYGVTLTIDQAAKIRSFWLQTFPEVKQYLEDASVIANGDGVVWQYGERRQRGGLHSRFTAVANTQFQGLVADAIKLAMWSLRDLRMIACVHDELVIEVPDDDHSGFCERIETTMIQALQELCPDVKITAEIKLSKHWYKQAKPCYDDTGRLVPWLPT